MPTLSEIEHEGYAAGLRQSYMNPEEQGAFDNGYRYGMYARHVSPSSVYDMLANHLKQRVLDDIASTAKVTGEHTNLRTLDMWLSYLRYIEANCRVKAEDIEAAMNDARRERAAAEGKGAAE